ncbi:M23 family metallopeptidase [Sphingomonas sp. UNC305MFCol5.2]|uniref:M23 family metallopeptidase n=1 Tax=Sphingomonas sp. UNC305MFCol5.2 TaxID=1449076 RepID=UPI000409A319|nr:M23 family metallopeptidase [Sphingomonas sp. UNC305MFCol5.2]
MRRARFGAALALGLLCAAAQARDAEPPAEAVQADPFALTGKLVQGGLATGTAPRGTTLLSLNGRPVQIAPDRRFLIAFDRDAGPTAMLVARLDAGGELRKRLSIAPRAWDISRLSTLPKYPVPRPEFERVRPAELAQINAARASRSDSQGWRQTFLWPAVGRISTLFGSQRIYAGEPGAYHSGIDIARPTGTIVLAPADGVVILATPRPFTLEGNLVLIDHGMGLNSAFMHLSRIDVKLGERVRRGQPIGAVGRSGRATGPHLHWGLRWNDARLDPLLVAGPMPAAD